MRIVSISECVDVKPEVAVTFCHSQIVMLARGWRRIFKSDYSVRTEGLYLLLDMNDQLRKCKREVGALLKDMHVGAHPRWSARAITRAADLGYVTLKKAPDFLPNPHVSEDGPDFRKVYP